MPNAHASLLSRCRVALLRHSTDGDRVPSAPPDTPHRPIRIVTNTSWFSDQKFRGISVQARRLSTGSLLATLAEAFATSRYDVAVLNCDLRRVYVFCLMRMILPTARCKVVALDPVLSPPSSWSGTLKAFLVRRLLAWVDLFIFYHKDTTQLQRMYGIQAERLRYIPFKINDYDNVLRAAISDEGFILACGRSYRDYGTLCRAVQDLAYDVRILAPVQHAEEHGTAFDFSAVPANVTVITDDGSGRSWIDWIARSKFVVLPILPNALTTAGISACLVAMALGKCLIITDGLVTRGIIDHGEAVVVPASEPMALRAAIVRVWEDSAFRDAIASAGRAYALSLGDVRRLAKDVRDMVMDHIDDAGGFHRPVEQPRLPDARVPT